MSGARGERPRAVVVGVQLPGVDDGEFASSLAELERLGETLGLVIVARVTQRRDGLAPGAVLGDGKLVELAELTGGGGKVEPAVPRKPNKVRARRAAAAGAAEADGAPDDDGADQHADEDAAPNPELATVVLVDHDLGPSQARNLERATDAEVLDRTSVILSIFQRHARTREAKLEVELARLAYLAPRLREQGASQDRQRGGIGGKGAGESALELDRRRIRDRMAELRRQLAALDQERGTRRSRRVEANTAALVGYTNAGKSSLMRALTGSAVYVADELFATLDTTVRALKPETVPRILVSDTVGFIKRLPHDLVQSFRSTLEEAKSAALLVHVVDGADPAALAQYEVTRSVLGEIGADQAPALVVINKADLLTRDQVTAWREHFPDAVLVSARNPDDVARLRSVLVEHFERDLVEAELTIPWSEQRRVHEIREACRVLSESHDELGTRLTVRAPAAILGRLQPR